MHFEIPAFETLVDLVMHRASTQANDAAFVFHHFRESQVERLSFAELDTRAKATASVLQMHNLQGQNILLLPSPGLDFIVAYLGCLYAGAHPVPTQTPYAEKDIQRMESIIRNALPAAVLLHSETKARLDKSDVQELRKLLVLEVDRIDQSLSADWQSPRITRQDLALIQYTSGSTGAPKGVMLSHANLLHNQKLIHSAFEHDDQSVVVGWLPIFHDMGLIGNVLQPLYLGRPSILFDPLAFVQKPLRWLQLISQYQATTSGAPNFGYELCVKRIKDEDKKDLDLSSWTLAFNGAEPVRKDTIDAFSQAFAECGFNKEAFYPCYGLAESSLFVTGISKKSAPDFIEVDAKKLSENKVAILSGNEDGKSCASISNCGYPREDLEVRIVNPDHATPCEPDEIGEIWISSPSSSVGYWQKPELTQGQFAQTISSNASVHPICDKPLFDRQFMRSGDLGFMHEGNLYVTGRLKDVIIINGKNHYPQDIELTASNSSSLLKGQNCCAFSIENNNREKLVLLQEVHARELSSKELSELKMDIREAVTKQHGLSPFDIVLLKRNSLPMTTSGKLQRFLGKQLYQSGGFEESKVRVTTATEEESSTTE